MSKLWRFTLGGGLLVVLAAVMPFSLTAQDKKGKDPEWKYGMNLRVRKAGVADFTKDTQRYGVEVFHDDNSDHLVYIDYIDDKVASLSVIKGNAEGTKAPEWRHAMDLSVRKAGEAKFTKETKKYGVEVFVDQNSGNLIYVCESGSIAVVPGSPAPAPGAAKAPEWTHGMELLVRKATERDFNKETKKISVEVYRDENNGNVVYVSETGSLAVVSGLEKKEGSKDPVWKYGFEVSARNAGESEFSKETQRYNIEVFQDESNGCVIYMSETGSLSVLPGVTVAVPTKVLAPEWKYASNLKVRKADEKEFSKDTKKYGVEFYQDENDKLLVAVTQSGNIAILKGK